MVLFERATFLTGVIAAQSQQRAEKVSVSPQIGNVTKKRHGHNFWISDLKFNHALDICVSEGVIQFQVRIPKIVAVSFFLTPPICGDTPTFSALC